jgi:ferric-dicitrate binding protein FerR (iron transport regulator)
MDSGLDATLDGGPAPRGRLPAGAELAAGRTAKLRLQWDDGILVDLGVEGRLAVRRAGLGLELRDGILGALVSPLPDGRAFAVGTPFGEVLCGDGQFSVILSSKVAIVHVETGTVRVKPKGGTEQAVPVGETTRMGQAP